METTDTKSEPTRTPSEVVEFWARELADAKRRDQAYRKTGREILERYDGRTDQPFNILYSNTETLAPALYSQVPVPVVTRRFKDEDPLGKAAAQASQRILSFLLDPNGAQAEPFDTGMRAVTMNALLPGRGELRVQYDATITEPPDDAADLADAAPPVVEGETVRCEAVQWDRVLYGYAKTWAQVPWIAYEEDIDREEAERLFGEDLAAQLTFSAPSPEPGTGDREDKQEQPKGGRKTCRIYQIWDRDGGKTVKYYCEQYKTGLLKEEDDPLHLTGFFPCPKPLTFVEKSYSQTPTALYTLYRAQAQELNELTRRIKHVTKAIKARGIYDGSLGGDLKMLMEADDTELVPSDNAASLAAEKGLDHAIWFLPIDKLILVLRELYTAREQCKQVIYEITGISDILRGASKASETLGAQEIKTQWGTLRLKNKQKEVQRYARDVLRIMLELAATKLSEETWAAMTGLPFLLSPQYNELTAIAQALSTEVQRVQAIQPPPQPGLPPAPPPPQVQQLQQIQQQLQAPQWAQVLDLLRNDLHRAYRIDIETNSTIEPEAADDQKQMQEVMAAISQVLNGVTPLVVSGALPFQAAQGLLLAIVRRYRFGAEVEDYIKAMQPPQPKDDGKAAQAQLQQQQEQAKQQISLHQQQASQALDQQTHQAEMTMAKRELALAKQEAELDIARKTLQAEQAIAAQKAAARNHEAAGLRRR